MSYYDYRTFLKSKIKLICPDLKEHKDGFNRDNIDSITASGGHHILPGIIRSEFITAQCDWYQDVMPINLWLIFCGGRYVKEGIDYALSKASCIRNEIIARDQYPIEPDKIHIRSEVLNFGAIGAPTNDNTVIIEMNINLYLEYCTNYCAN